MRKILSGLVALMILSGGCQAVFAAEANVTNGDFSNETTGWKTTSASLNIVPGGVSGDCGEVVMNAEYGRAYNYFKFQKGVKYRLSVYVKLKEGRNTASLIVDHRSFGDQSLIKAAVKDVRVSGKEWTKLTAIYQWNGNGTGEAYLYVRIGDALTPLTHYVDSLSVVQYGESVKSFMPTVLNDGEMAVNSGFDGSADGYITADGQLALYSGDGAEETDGCGVITAYGNGNTIGQRFELSPYSIYKVSAYVKSSGGYFDCPFGIVTENTGENNDGRYIKDYSISGQANSNVQILNSDITVGDKWTYVSVVYTYRGNSACDAYIGLYPKVQKGSVYYLDKFSVVKTGMSERESEKNDSAPEEQGFFVDGVLAAPDGGYDFINGAVVVSAKAISELLGAKYSMDNAICYIEKGFTKLKIDSETGVASANGCLLPIRYIQKNGEDFRIDTETVCKALGADIYISSETNTIKISMPEVKTGLANTARRMITDKQATIAFVGGAAAYGKGAGQRNETSYTSLVMKQLRNMYPDYNFTEFNNSIGITDSTLEIYRIGEVINKQPDVIFIDFCNEDKSVKGLENLICRIKTDLPHTDIVILESINEEMESVYKLGNMPDIIKEYDAVASKYGIPVVNIGLMLYDEALAAKETVADYMTYIHFPNDCGHQIYADLICDFIESCLKAAGDSAVTRSDKIYSYTKGAVIDISEAKSNGFIEDNDVLLGNIGDEVTFGFEGNTVGLLWDIGIDTGAVECIIDGKSYGTVMAFDEFGVRSVHTNYVLLADDLSDGEHTLTVRVVEEKDRMSLGYRIMLRGILAGTAAGQ